VVTLPGIDTLKSMGGCDSIVSRHARFAYLPNHCTDTLIIRANLTGYDPPTFSQTIRLYPNPATDHLFIGVDDPSLGHRLIILNNTGQTVFESQLDPSLFEPDLNDWPGPGTYLVRLLDSNDNLLTVKRIILR